MKKFVAILLVICLCFVGLLSCASKSAEEAEKETVGENAAPEALIETATLDYDALYALHEPDEVVLIADGQEICWDEYFSWLYLNCAQLESYFNSMAYYGVALSWDSPVTDDESYTFAVAVTEAVQDSFRQYITIEQVAAQDGMKMGEELEQALKEQKEADIVSVLGEGGTEEEFEQYLADNYMSLSSYERTSKANRLYQDNFVNCYGASGEKVSDEDAMSYLVDNGYMSANHILFLTTDMATGEALEESVIAEKKQQAEDLAKELQAVTDKDELLKLFGERKQELCEDSGKETYADGYTFTPGTMVAEFETAVQSLAEYQVSDVVESPYGYHVIMTLPLDVDRVIEYSNAGTALTARSLWANNDYSQRLQQYADNMEITYAEGFEVPDLMAFVK